MMSHPPIPISELAEHIELLKANDNLRLSQEYEVRCFTWILYSTPAPLLFSGDKPVKPLLHEANRIQHLYLCVQMIFS